MATLTVRRSDLFPVGTEVGAYPARNRVHGGKPSGTATATATVAADGSLTIAGVPEREALTLWALVAGVNRYLDPAVSAPPPPYQTLKQRISKRRALVGA